MKASLTGTPGTGKSTVGKLLAEKGYKVVELGDLAREKGVLGDYDAERGTYEVDPEELQQALDTAGLGDDLIILGHLSHLLEMDMIIVLRCRPSVLAERLTIRGYPRAKVSENAEAEALDIILFESVESGRPTYEVDTTSLSPADAAQAVIEILAGEKEKYAVGNIDWSEEALDWS